MKRSIWLAVPLAIGMLTATACNLIEDNAQYIAPFAAEIVLVNVPADQLADYGVNAPDTVSLMVAVGHLTNPSSPDSSSPFSGEAVSAATVTVTTPEGAVYPLTEDSSEPGVYLLTSQDQPDFKYEVGASYRVDITYNKQSFWSKFTASDQVTLTSPATLGEYHAPGTDLTLQWAEPKDAAVVAMVDENGNQVYDNIPRDLNGLYGFLTSSNLTSEVVPGDKFTENHAYGIGLAGMSRSAVDENTFSTSLNWLVSNVITGTAAVTAVTTVDTSQIPQQ